MTDVPEKPLHIPVLLDTVTELLAPAQRETYVDCTAGLGGHAAAIAARLAGVGGGMIVLNDMDPANIARAHAHVTQVCQSCAAVKVLNVTGDGGRVGGNFVDVPRKLLDMGLAADMVLADLGFASNHVDDGSRGFSFMHDGPLDMRMDPSIALSAADLVNQFRLAQLVH